MILVAVDPRVVISVLRLNVVSLGVDHLRVRIVHALLRNLILFGECLFADFGLLILKKGFVYKFDLLCGVLVFEF